MSGRTLERTPAEMLAIAEEKKLGLAGQANRAKQNEFIAANNKDILEKQKYTKNGVYDVDAHIGANLATKNWNAQAADRAAGAQRAIEAQPGYAAAHAANLAAGEKKQKDALSKAALDLNLALDSQRELQSRRQGRAGTFNTGPLGIPMGVFDTPTIGSGGKTLLGQ